MEPAENLVFFIDVAQGVSIVINNWISSNSKVTQVTRNLLILITSLIMSVIYHSNKFLRHQRKANQKWKSFDSSRLWKKTFKRANLVSSRVENFFEYLLKEIFLLMRTRCTMGKILDFKKTQINFKTLQIN